MSETEQVQHTDGKRGELPYIIVSIALVIAIIALAIFFRSTMLKYYGFYEPDGFYHYSVIRYAVNHGFVVPHVLPISGWPVHAAVTEPFGLYYITLVPYFLLQGTGITYYTIERDIPILFGILDAIGAYFLSRYLSKDRSLGLLSMALVALSMGDAARTTGLIYRGDSFSPVFLIAALLLTLAAIKSDSRNKRVALSLVAAIPLSLSNLVFSGGSFAVAVYMFAFAMVVAFGYVLANEKLMNDGWCILVTLGLWYLLVNGYILGGQMPAQALTGLDFIPVLAVMAIALFAALQMTRRNVLGSWPLRLAAIAGYIVVAILVVYIADPAFVATTLINNLYSITNQFTATIQELQPPTYAFMYASFGVVLFTTPTSLLMIPSTIYPGMPYLFWALAIMASFIYLFMHVYDSGKGFMSGNARFRFDVEAPMLILIAYLGVTAYLQLNAIRFNSLFSVPLAIFSAYTIYWIFTFAKGHWDPAKFTAIVFLAIFLGYLIYTDYQYTAQLFQADNINPVFISALQWFAANTQPNATVLTLWPDGSVVEGVANRTSVTDSVGSQYADNGLAPLLFARWLYNSTPDPGFLTSNVSGSPQYLLVRNNWLFESQGILTEAEFPYNQSQLASLYGFQIFPSISEQVPNDSFQQYQFQSVPNSQGQVITVRVIVSDQNGVQNVSAYAVQTNGVSLFKDVAFYNVYSGNYSIIPSRANSTNDLAFLIGYSPIPNPSIPVNITSAYLITQGMFQSNLFRLLYFCNNIECSWDNSQASLRLAYVNGDTKIYSVTYYNSTGSGG